MKKILSVDSNLLNSKVIEQDVKEYFNKYDNEYLPIWSMVEIISLNTLSKIY